MNKQDVVRAILGNRLYHPPQQAEGCAFAPSNIALVKYWGKRNSELNLPVTSSLSISLADQGTTTRIAVNTKDDADKIYLNGQAVDRQSSFAKRAIDFLNLFRLDPSTYFYVDTHSTIPIAAGLASSASGFASLIQALNALFGWELPRSSLSILARLGSGSAARSLWSGFVEWQKGERADGMDSVGKPLDIMWPDLCVGLLILSAGEKPLSSRVAMQRTIETSLFYRMWPTKVHDDLKTLKEALDKRDFECLGHAAESNALAMHATLHTAWPPITYCLPETLQAMQRVWQLRNEGCPVYFTQDAGPNLKLLFLRENLPDLCNVFQNLQCIIPFQVR